MADQEWSDIYVAFTMSLRAFKLWEKLIALLFQVFLNTSQIQKLGEAIWRSPTNFSFITYQTQKIQPLRVLVKSTW